MEHKREEQRREHRVSTSYRSKTRGTEMRGTVHSRDAMLRVSDGT
ncbi:MAG: hypothetical protein VSS75_006700 [Candidatus Parabeggiatoa sp.]|nr:hypothetical protein [Candidatus Parabeggiatoa sp.]